jgi:glucokinase
MTDYRDRYGVDRAGLVVPGPVDPRTGTVLIASNLGWRDLDLRPHLPAGLTIDIDNDAGAAAWAEHRFGEHRHGDSTVLVAVGTGIGAGIVIGDRLLRGHTGAGGEIGHMPFEPDGPLCECGSHGCWELYASGSALHRAAIAGGWASAVDLLAVAERGDVKAAEVGAEVARQLVRGIVRFTAVLDPEQVLLGGGLGAEPRFQPYIAAAAEAAEVTPPRARVPIRVASLGPMAGVIGAGDLARG